MGTYRLFAFEIFMEVLNMSVVAGAAALVVMAVRIVLKNMPKIFSYALWAVVLFRLLCPVSLSSQISFYRLLDVTTVTNGEYINGMEVFSLPEIGTEDAQQQPAQSDLSFHQQADGIETIFMWASAIWLGGVFAALVYSIVSFLMLRRKLGEASRLRDNIYLADHIASPFVIGLFKPRIYLLSSMSEQEQEYVILHEQHHIRRKDHVIKLLAFAALIIHWFNPIVWLAFILSKKDMEMSCDEAVIQRMGTRVRGDYSASLLKLAMGHQIFAGAPLAFGEGDTKDRIKNLAKWKQPGFLAILGAALLSITVLLVCLMNPAGKDVSETVKSMYPGGLEAFVDEEESTLKYYFKEFFKGGQTDYRGILMAKICQKIIYEMEEGQFPETEILNGQEWFQAFYNGAKTLEQRYTEDELQEQYPASWILLETEKEYITENGLGIYGEEEVDFRQLMEIYHKKRSLE